jgi:two-component system chemotaxis sensor kinase CheA
MRHAGPAGGEPSVLRVELASVAALAEDLTGMETQLSELRDGERELERARQRARSLAHALEAAAGDARTAAEQLSSALAALAQQASARLDAVEQALRRVREQVDALRLSPASEIHASLERAARDAARELERRVDFDATGGETRVDRSVLYAARDALMHLVRNAVVHGIEPPGERARAGKPAAGRVAVRAERRGDRVAFVCEDDGAGIDLQAVRRAASARGRMSADEAAALDDTAALNLIFSPGISTAHAVSELSGRGVGLEVAHAVAARFGGRVEARSRPGLGAELSLELPVSLSSFVALEMEAQGLRALVPLDAVAGTERVAASDLVRSAHTLAVLHGGELVPFVPLALLLAGEAAGEPPAMWSVVILRSASGKVALGANRLAGAREVALTSLPAALGRWPIFAGAVIEAGNAAVLALDPDGAVRAALARSDAGLALAPAAPRRLPILVTDDSLTTRVLVQSMLEAAGHEVDLAVSGEDALQKAALRRHGLYIIDIEMPGMNGFELIAAMRADPALRDTPVIVLTSLSSALDRERGAKAGADAFLVKGEFDQRLFLRRVEELLR